MSAALVLLSALTLASALQLAAALAEVPPEALARAVEDKLPLVLGECVAEAQLEEEGAEDVDGQADAEPAPGLADARALSEAVDCNDAVGTPEAEAASLEDARALADDVTHAEGDGVTLLVVVGVALEGCVADAAAVDEMVTDGECVLLTLLEALTLAPGVALEHALKHALLQEEGL